MLNIINNQILLALGLDSNNEVTKLAGNANDNFLIQTRGRKVVVKCLGEHTAVNEELEGSYRQYLTDNNLPVSPFLRFNNNQYTFSNAGSDYVAIDYIEGVEARGKAPEIAEQLAAIMAKLHTLKYESLPVRVNWLDGNYLDHILTEVNLDPSLISELKRQNTSFPDFWNMKLPKGIVHGDLHDGNIIVSTTNVVLALIDWEETGIEPIILDIAGTVQALCQNEDGFDEQIFNQFFNAYQSIRSLTDPEIMIFDEAVRYRSFIVYIWALMKFKQGLMTEGKFNYFKQRFEDHPIVPEIKKSIAN
jgi:Ser/Thr protein kinase RdoA (MazF antagonist)